MKRFHEIEKKSLIKAKGPVLLLTLVLTNPLNSIAKLQIAAT